MCSPQRPPESGDGRRELLVARLRFAGNRRLNLHAPENNARLIIGERNLTHRLPGLYALQDLTCLMFGQL